MVLLAVCQEQIGPKPLNRVDGGQMDKPTILIADDPDLRRALKIRDGKSHKKET